MKTKSKVVYGLLAFVGCILLTFSSIYKYLPTATTNETSATDIVGPIFVEIGELVKLSIDGNKTCSFSWQVMPETTDVVVYDGGRKAAFSAREKGIFTVVVAVSDAGKASIKVHHVRAGVEPEDTIEWISLWSEKIKLDKVAAGNLADVFSKVSDQIDAGLFTDIPKIIEATTTANRKLVGNDQTVKSFMSQLQRLLASKVEAGKLATVEDHAVVWKEISEGLKQWASK